MNTYSEAVKHYFDYHRLPRYFWKPDTASKIRLDLINQKLIVDPSLKINPSDLDLVLQWVMSIIRGLSLRDHYCRANFTMKLSDITYNLAEALNTFSLQKCGFRGDMDARRQVRNYEELAIYFAGCGAHKN